MCRVALPAITELPLRPSEHMMFAMAIQSSPICVHPPVSPPNPVPPSIERNLGRHQCEGKGPWTAAEDKALLDAMASFSGHICWEELSKRIPGRSAKQCRERWQFRLHPDVSKAPFEVWEDDLIVNERVAMGNHWAQIAAKLPGRTSCSVKNRWYTVLRNRKTERVARRTKIGSAQSNPFYLETVLLRDRRELWERNPEKKASLRVGL
jgi:hypothetical protein